MSDGQTLGAARKDAAVRRLGGFLRGVFIYGLLIAGSCVFALPFVWMVGTSFKVDREMFGEKITLMPRPPRPAARSPYLDPYFFTAPGDRVYESVRPFIEESLREKTLPLPTDVAGRNDAPSLLAPGVYGRLRDTLPAKVWSRPATDMQAALRAAMTDELLDEVSRKIYRALTFTTVRVRSLDVQERELTAGTPLSQIWSIIAGPARWADRSSGNVSQADLAYDFSAPGKQEVELAATFDLPFESERLHRVLLSMTPDDAWHALDFFFERNGALYQASRPQFTGQFLPTMVLLQEFGPDDAPDSNKIKLWIPCRKIDAGPQYESAPRRLKIRMVLRESSPLDAWWAKCHRNYREALNYIPFWRYAATSLFLVVLNIVGNVFSCSLGAYAFSRLQWPGRNISFGVMLATMMIPPQVTMIPFFLIIKHLGWYNTLKPLWVISFFGNAFNIFLLRQFMKGIPRDLEDAAKIDGCNFLHIYWYVIMPLIKPTLACIAIFTFMGVWNDFMGPLIYLADQRLYPLSLGLYAFQVQRGGDYGMMMASSLLMTLPVIILFFFAQKYFIQGISLTGIKG